MTNNVLERFVGPVEFVTKYVTRLRDGGLFLSPEQVRNNVALVERARRVIRNTSMSVARQVDSNVLVEFDRELQEALANFSTLTVYQRGLLLHEVMALCYLKGARAMQDQLIAEGK